MRASSQTLLLLAFTLLSVQCADGPARRAGQMVGPEGGVLRSADERLSLVFPPGALAQETEIVISRATQSPAGLVGDLWSLAPAGTSFLAPVSLSIRYDSGELGDISPEQLLLGRFQDGAWQPADDIERDLDGGAVSGTLMHFSDWGLYGTEASTGPEPGSGPAFEEVNQRVCALLDATRTWNHGLLLMMEALQPDFAEDDLGDRELSDEELRLALHGLERTTRAFVTLRDELDLLERAQDAALGVARKSWGNWSLNQLVNRERIDQHIKDNLGAFGEELVGTADELLEVMYNYWNYLIEFAYNGTQEYDDLRKLNCILRYEVDSEALGRRPWIDWEEAYERADAMYEEIQSWDSTDIIMLHHQMTCLPTYLVYVKPFIQGKLRSLVETGAKFYFDTVMNTFVKGWDTVTSWFGRAEAVVQYTQGGSRRAPAAGAKDAGGGRPAFAVLFFVPTEAFGLPITVAAPALDGERLVVPMVPKGEHTVFVYSGGHYPLVAQILLEGDENEFVISGFQALPGVADPQFPAETTGAPGPMAPPAGGTCPRCEGSEYVIRHESLYELSGLTHGERVETVAEATFDLEEEGQRTDVLADYVVHRSMWGIRTEDGDMTHFSPASFSQEGVIEWAVELWNEDEGICWTVTSTILHEESTDVQIHVTSADGSSSPPESNPFVAFESVFFPHSQQEIGCGEPPFAIIYDSDADPFAPPPMEGVSGRIQWSVLIDTE